MKYCICIATLCAACATTESKIESALSVDVVNVDENGAVYEIDIDGDGIVDVVIDNDQLPDDGTVTPDPGTDPCWPWLETGGIDVDCDGVADYDDGGYAPPTEPTSEEDPSSGEACDPVLMDIDGDGNEDGVDMNCDGVADVQWSSGVADNGPADEEDDVGEPDGPASHCARHCDGDADRGGDGSGRRGPGARQEDDGDDSAGGGAGDGSGANGHGDGWVDPDDGSGVDEDAAGGHGDGSGGHGDGSGSGGGGSAPDQQWPRCCESAG